MISLRYKKPPISNNCSSIKSAFLDNLESINLSRTSGSSKAISIELVYKFSLLLLGLRCLVSFARCYSLVSESTSHSNVLLVLNHFLAFVINSKYSYKRSFKLAMSPRRTRGAAAKVAALVDSSKSINDNQQLSSPPPTPAPAGRKGMLNNMIDLFHRVSATRLLC